MLGHDLVEPLGELAQGRLSALGDRVADPLHRPEGMVDVERAAGHHGAVVGGQSSDIDQAEFHGGDSMGPMFIGIGTVTNVVTVALGAVIGRLLGDRIPERTSGTITDVLGLITLVLGVGSALTMSSQNLADAVGAGAPMLIVLGSLLFGAIVGSALRIEQRLEWGAAWLRQRFSGTGDAGTFVDAIVTPTLLFCIGPLTILGSLSDGLGRGADQLLVKAVLDGFAAIAFASTLGWGVLFSAIAVGLVQGSLTLAAFLLGDLFSMAQIDALTATGGVMLMALGVRLLKLKNIPVGDLLPALVFAPVLVALVAGLR